MLRAIVRVDILTGAWGAGFCGAGTKFATGAARFVTIINVFVANFAVAINFAFTGNTLRADCGA